MTAVLRRGRASKRRVFFVVLCLVMLGAGQMTAYAVAGKDRPSAGTATTGQHGQECPPGYHDTVGGACEPNGGGRGNCGDNQSGNDNGLGNGGNDNGYGHVGHRCERTTWTTPTTGTTSTTRTTSTTPTIPTTGTTRTTPATPTTGRSPTTPSTTTGPFVPPTVRCATRLTVGKRVFVVGRKSRLVIRITGADGQPSAEITVLVRGAGVKLSATTNSAGVASVIVRPRSPGVIRITIAQPSAACAALSRLVRAVGIFKPPKPNFTGR